MRCRARGSQKLGGEEQSILLAPADQEHVPTLGLVGPQAHGGKRALDRVGSADVFPVLGREVIEREQGLFARQWAALSYFA